MWMPMRKLLTATAVVAVVAASACSSAPEEKEGKSPEASMLGLEVRGDAEVEKYDLNGDGEADDWRYYIRKGDKDVPKEERPRLLARQDLDLNFDKSPDVRRHFNEQGTVVREEMDLDFDGKYDAIDYYSDGALFRRDLALNFAGSPSIIKFYNEAQLARKERDTNGDGKMDTIEYYEGGKLIRIGEDRDGDGKPDVYTEVEQDEAGGEGGG